MAYYFIFVFLRFLFRSFREVFRAFPKVGMSFGVVLVILSAYISFQGYKDYSRYSNGPLSTTVAVACSRVTDDGLLVRLEDCQIHNMNKVRIEKRMTKGGKVFVYTYVPITDPKKKVLILALSVKEGVGSEDSIVREPVAGFLKPMGSNGSAMNELVNSGFDTEKFVPAGSKVFELCTTCSTEGHGELQWMLAGAMTIAGVSILYSYSDKRPKPANAAEQRDSPTRSRCPGCGLINSADAYICRRCGNRC